MLVWADNKFINKKSDEICQKIEKAGKSSAHLITNYKVIPNVWTRTFKAWEYLFIYLWLDQFSKNLNLNKKLKIMDFGPGISPFAQFLANENFDVWGIDDNSWGYIDKTKNKLNSYYPNVSYWIGNIDNFNLTKFDAIVSCSVLEHLNKPGQRIKEIKKLKSLLVPHGKMMHAVDFYYPEYKAALGTRTNFYKLAQAVNFIIPNLKMCPGSPNFDFEFVKEKINLLNLKKNKPQSRIAIGDDI